MKQGKLICVRLRHAPSTRVAYTRRKYACVALRALVAMQTKQVQRAGLSLMHCVLFSTVA